MWLEGEHKTFTDQLGRAIRLDAPPKRIVSLVPSQTELLSDLELEDEVVGITKFCVHPKTWYRTKTRVGGTKKINLEAIRALNPDLIIANKEENTKADITALESDFPVWVSDVNDLDSAIEMIQAIGSLCDREQQAVELTSKISSEFKLLKQTPKHPLSVVYLIWKDPLMASGSDTFIHEMITECGWINAIQKARYPEVTPEELNALNPDLVLLSSEPFPFKGKHTKELEDRFPNLSFKEVDGELFSWYGSRLIQSPSYFTRILSEIK